MDATSEEEQMTFLHASQKVGAGNTPHRICEHPRKSLNRTMIPKPNLSTGDKMPSARLLPVTTPR